MSASTLTRARLAETLHDRVGVSKKESGILVEDVLALLSDALVAGEKVKLSGFGTFELRDKHARPGRNPRTNEELTISRRRVVTFRPSQVLRESIRNGDAAQLLRTGEST
ncbi:MAG: integration host factor subunit alpha [Myxococcota bacterium]|nr:integration host factor subunit alpha [Myxococcota bacterium]MEC8423639.1 integration host factor subunit alpha [Myxococcota bacterium]